MGGYRGGLGGGGGVVTTWQRGVWNPYAPPASPSAYDEEFWDKTTLGATGLTEQDAGAVGAWSLDRGALKLSMSWLTGHRATAQWVEAPSDDEQEWYTACTFPAITGTASVTTYAGLGLSAVIGGVNAIDRCALLAEGLGGQGRIDMAKDPNWTSGSGGAGYKTTGLYQPPGHRHFICTQFKKSASGSDIRIWWWLSGDGVNWQRTATRTASLSINPAFVSLYARAAGADFTTRFHFLRLSRAGASGIVGTVPQPSGGAVGI